MCANRLRSNKQSLSNLNNKGGFKTNRFILNLEKMEPNKLHANFEKLRAMIPKKPEHHTDDFPVSIAESLNKYLRMRTICIMRNAVWFYDSKNWPMPLYVNPDNIKIGALHDCMFIKLGMNDFRYFDTFGGIQIAKNKPHELGPVSYAKFYRAIRFRKRKKLIYFDWLIPPILCHFFKITNLDDFNVELFEVNYKYYKKKVMSNDILGEKSEILKDIFQTFENKNYAACICTLYPLLDFVTREYFKTNKLDKDITSINGLFKAAGFGLNDIDNLKPGAATAKAMHLMMEKKITHDEMMEMSAKSEARLGFAGIALSSFLHFGGKYYEFYRKDNSNGDYLNRHAIIHGASNDYANKVNAVKLFTYLYLMLELEPVLKIVFEEN